MSFSINERLLRGLNQEKKQEFITAYKANSWMLRTMKSILEREIEILVLASESDEPFKSPNYDEWQRANIAERKALRNLIKLLPKGESDG